jgi:hypothetical protein
MRVGKGCLESVNDVIFENKLQVATSARVPKRKRSSTLIRLENLALEPADITNDCKRKICKITRARWILNTSKPQDSVHPRQLKIFFSEITIMLGGAK